MTHSIQSIEELGALIRRERKHQGLRQPDLAAAAGTSIRFIVEIEGGKRNPTLKVVERLALALGVEPAELLKKS